jgi:hypothetical protein
MQIAKLHIKIQNCGKFTSWAEAHPTILHRIQNPATRIVPVKEVNIARYVVEQENWERVCSNG